MAPPVTRVAAKPTEHGLSLPGTHFSPPVTSACCRGLSEVSVTWTMPPSAERRATKAPVEALRAVRSTVTSIRLFRTSGPHDTTPGIPAPMSRVTVRAVAASSAWL